MAVRLRPRTRTTDLHDLLEADARCVALEGFRPSPIGHEIERGRYFKLTDEIVRQYPQFFAVLVPVSEVLGAIEIER
jgi:hypothetical protein